MTPRPPTAMPRYNSEPMVESILSRARPTDIAVEPYVHFAVHRPLPEAYFVRLEENYPADERIIAFDRMCKEPKRNNRYSTNLTDSTNPY